MWRPEEVRSITTNSEWTDIKKETKQGVRVKASERYRERAGEVVISRRIKTEREGATTEGERKSVSVCERVRDRDRER